MLRLDVPELEFFDERTEEFKKTKATTVMMEHSLVSISKWEAKWKKIFLRVSSSNDLTPEELYDYIRCMTTTQNVSESTYTAIFNSSDLMLKIRDYLQDPMTATTFAEDRINAMTGQKSLATKNYSSEEIYYYMFANQIPIECQKWNIHRLITLLRIFGIKSEKPKKMSKAEIMRRNRALNEQRKRQLGTLG
ncbi:MAG: hypothetical protein HUJ78_00055 [Mogibacterium sp.]|nr:hypothetical protein [Mogibacterium sp.]